MTEVPVTPSAIRPIPASAVRALYTEAGWWPERTESRIERLLAAGPAVGAWSPDGRLVGFARAVTDGVCRAYVEDVVVAVSVRGQGIGRRLMTALLTELSDVDVVSLFCGEDLTGFYEASGFSFTGQRIAHRSLSEPPRVHTGEGRTAH